MIEFEKDIDKYKSKVEEINKVFEDIWVEESVNDTTINSSMIDNFSYVRSKIKQKWLLRYKKLAQFKNRLDTILNRLYSDLYNYYKLDHDIAYKDSEIKKQIEGNENYTDLVEMINDMKDIIKFIEETINNVDAIQWDIKNIIEYKKISLY